MNFDEAIRFILRWEGGYANDPNDPGGETKFGISKRAHPEVDIKELTQEDAIEIYYERYWLESLVPALPAEIRLAYFDSVINQGPGAAAKMLQEAAGGIKVDGAIGPNTLKKLYDVDVDAMLVNFLALRALRYTRTMKFDIYGRGWMRRLMDIAVESGANI